MVWMTPARMFSRDVLLALSGYTDRLLVELRRGRGLTEAWLAQQLRPYGIKPKTIRIGDDMAKGYVQEEMMETFRRYIPKAELEAFLAEQKERSAQKPEGDGENPESPKSGNQPDGGGATGT